MKADLKNKFSRKYLNLEEKLPLEKFIPSAFVIFLLCIFSLSIFTYKNIERYRNNMDWISYTNEVIKRLDNSYLNAMTFPLFNRGYAITGDPDYLMRFDSLETVTKAGLLELKDFTHNNSNYKELVDSLEFLILSNIRINELRDVNSLQERIDITKTGRTNLQQISTVIRQLKTISTGLLIERKISAEESNSAIQLFIIITSLFSFFVIGLSLFISERLIKNKSKAEDLLLKSYEELEERVVERTLELQSSNEKLSDEIGVRKKTEETLRESEQRFKMMADSAPVLIWISGKDMLSTYFNRAWLEFTGRTLEQELGFGWADGVHIDDLQKTLDTYTTAFQKREEFEMEYRLRNCKGEYRWIIVKGIPRFEGNEFAGYIGSCIDINERKKNERFLKIQYEVSKTLAESETIEEVSKKLLKNICMGIDWNFGMLWIANDKNEFIKAESLWSDSETDLEEYSNLSKETGSSLKGIGFLGEIYNKGRSRWTKDINTDKEFIGKELAAKMGWNSGLGIPVSNGKNVIAVIECFNKKSLEEKQDLIDVLESASRQFGNFIKRKHAENLRISNLELEEKVNERTNELASALTKLLNEISEKEEIQNKIKLFAHAIRSIKDCVFITDLNNKTIFVNQAFENTYGYNENQLLGKEIPVLNDNISKTLRNDILNKSLKEGWRGELMTFKKDGTSFSTYLSTSSIKDEEGKSEALVGICQDITDLKNTEEIIRKRNSLLNVLNDVIRFTNRTFDFKKAVHYAINKVCEYTHWQIGHYYLKKNDELISANLWNDNQDAFYNPFKEYSLETIFRAGNGYPGRSLYEGRPAWIRIEDLSRLKLFKREKISNKLGLKTGIWVPILMDKEVIGVLEFFKKEEESIDQEILDCIMNIGLELGSLCEKLDIIAKIRESEKMLNDAQHIAKLGSWEWDVEKNVVSWSNEMFEVYGLNKEEFNPTFEGFLERIHPADFERVKSEIQKALENKKPFDFYHRLITPAGKIKTVKSQGEIYLDENNDVIRMFGTGHDVTEIREAEEELKRANTKLIEAPEELIYNEKLAALGRFSSGIAHEIRNPLANINSLAQLISKADIDEKNKKRLNYITTNVDIANKIIKNLLSFASPEELEFSHFDLKEILNNILESVEARCNTGQIKVEKEFPEDLPPIYLDKLKLEVAFMNFISNAIEAMDLGGTLTIKVSEDKQNEQIIILIKDTGIGIPQENIDKILEPFFTTKDDGVGLGMGLAHQTIVLHHGTFNMKAFTKKEQALK